MEIGIHSYNNIGKFIVRDTGRTKSEYEQSILTSVYILLSTLDNVQELSLRNVTDEQLLKSFQNIKEAILEGISSIKKDLEILSKTAEWSNLNISFFGETNAGKSTIIEALINGDGRSIGEGYKDFTRTVSKIAYDNVNLLDMPGIEGREHKVIQTINDALQRSHVIFYVIGTNKEPEERTISKIGKLLKDTAKVYSIINVRGKPTVYKHKSELLDEHLLRIENRIRHKFANLLGRHYAGNKIVNAYLALLANDGLEERFQCDKKKALAILGSEQEIKEFSRIRSLNEVIRDLSRDVHDEMIISNTYKFLKSISILISKILKEKKNFDSFIKEANKLINMYMEDANNIILKYEDEIHTTLDINIKNMKVELKKTLNQSIDNGDSKSSIESKLNTIQKKYEDVLESDINKLLSSMQSEILGKIDEFKNRLSLQIQSFNFRGYFDLDTIFESLKINFKYIIGQILDVSVSLIGIIITFGINIIAGIIITVVTLARKIWNWFVSDPDKRRRKAKSKAMKEIDSKVKAKEKNLRAQLNREFRKIKRSVRKPVSQLKNSMRGIKKISMSIDGKILDIKRSQAEISLLLTKELLGEEILFAYIDLQLSKAVAIGYGVNQKVRDYLDRIFRLGSVKLYSSYTEWLNKVGTIDAHNTFVAKDEFNYRAISVAALYENNEIRFNRIKRSEYK